MHVTVTVSKYLPKFGVQNETMFIIVLIGYEQKLVLIDGLRNSFL